MIRLFLPAALCLAVSGCSSLSVTDDYDRAFDFTPLKSWSWHVGRTESAATQDQVVTLLTARIKSALEPELTGKGYARAESGGDFEVSFHTTVERRVETTTYDAYGYGWRHGHVYSGPELYSYEEGTLIIDFIDPKSKNMIWRGTASGVVDRAATAEERDQRVKEAVQKILALFPPLKPKA